MSRTPKHFKSNKPSFTRSEREVRTWLKGHRIAAEQIDRERVRFLHGLTPREALEVYLNSCGAPAGIEARKEPSPLLMAMRHALDKRIGRGAQRR